MDKPWGYELHWAKTDRYVGKLIHVNAGHALSLQYHNQKDETIFLWAGRMLFEIQEETASSVKREMKPGESVHVTPGTVHRMTAITTATSSKSRRPSWTTSSGSRIATGAARTAPAPASRRHDVRRQPDADRAQKLRTRPRGGLDAAHRDIHAHAPDGGTLERIDRMGSVNKVILVGNLGRDAELRYTPGGAPVATLNLATTEVWNDKARARSRKRPNGTGSCCGVSPPSRLNEYLVKGKQIYVEGRLQTRQWDDKDGNKRYTTEIRGDRIVLLGGGGGGGGGRRRSARAAGTR